MTTDRARQIFANRGGTLRACEAIEAGIHPRVLYAMRDSGELETLSRGVFRLKGLSPMGDPLLAVVAKRVPQAVVCLESALAFHGLANRSSEEVHVALPRTAGEPSLRHPRLHVHRFTEHVFCAGIETHIIDGVAVRIYGSEKTVADCLKFRNRIGIRVATQALERYLDSGKVKLEELRSAARLCHVERLLDPYLSEANPTFALQDQVSRHRKRKNTLKMLKRQRIVLGLLHRSGGSLGRTALVKMAFLLGEETDVKSRESYYDFVPYKYGPFSFALYRELGAMEQAGRLNLHDDRVELHDSIVNGIEEIVGELALPVRRAVEQIVAQYGNITQHRLLKSVYQRYPWYASASELQDLVPPDAPARTTAQAAVYTVGYEGKSVDAFFDELLHNGIHAILDVRANPISRKYGFAKRSLSEIAGRLGVRYVHLPELGIDPRFRTELGDFNSYQKLLERYEKEMLPNRKDAIHRLVDLIRAQPSALLCVEKDVQCCHRSRLAEAASRYSSLPVVHL